MATTAPSPEGSDRLAPPTPTISISGPVMPRRLEPIYSSGLNLTEDTWAAWLVDMRAFLRSRQLWQFTQKQYDSKSTLSEDEWTLYAEAAADIMTVTLSPSIKEKCNDDHFNDGYLLLARLREICEPTGHAQYFRLTRQLFTLDYAKFPNLQDYLRELKVINDKIERTKLELTAETRALLCLAMTLPAEYNSVVQMWAIQPSPPSFDDACKTLQELDQRLREIEKVDIGRMSLNTTTLPFWGQVTTCSHCKKKHESRRCCVCPGANKPHSVDRCWTLYPEQRPEWAKNEQNPGHHVNAVATRNVGLAYPINFSRDPGSDHVF